MKLYKLLTVSLCTLTFACSEDMNNIGSGIQPEGDKIIPLFDTIKAPDITAKTIQVEKIENASFAEWLGRISDNYYGSLSVDFMTQFFPAPEMTFGGELNKWNKIDSMVLRMRYISFLGDSLAPMQLSVYELNKTPLLPYNAPSNLNPDLYCTPSSANLLGRKTYTASDISIPDSIKEESAYARTVDLTLPQAISQKFYNEVKNNNETFSSISKFLKFFPGIYVKCTYGNSSVVDFRETSVRFYYKEQTNDTTVTQKYNDYLASTTEVSSVNIIRQTNPDYMTLDNPDTTYVKTPAALITEIDFPTQSILELLKKSGPSATLNAVNFSLPVYATPKNKLGITPPVYLLLIRSKDAEKFFATPHTVDNVNSFYATYDSKNNVYNFGNINKFFQNIYNANNDTTVTNEKMSLIPVTSINISTSATAIKNSLYPALVKINKKELKLTTIIVKKEDE